MAGVSAARKAAYRILLSMERESAHADELLRSDAVNKLSSPDRNLTTALVMGVLRWQLPLDEQIRKYLAKPNAKLDPEIRIALRLGALQLLCLDRIPAHAAIDESVQLAKQAGHKFAAGMVNAVLRAIARNAEEPGSRLDASRAYPDWMIRRWEHLFGHETTCSICALGQQQPRLAVRLMSPAAEHELIAEGIQLAPGVLLNAARTVISGDVTSTASFRSGRIRIQDEGSQLVAEIAAHVGRQLTHDGLRILDACAAPGGKTLVLAERLPKAHIVACEASPLRHAALRARLTQYSERIECWLADASTLAEEASFDMILVDAPCSGTGTLGRNPEIRHRLREEELARQAERQKAILRAALRAVKPESRVVYSTCSLEPEENESVLAETAAHLIPPAEYLPAMQREGILTESGARELQGLASENGTLRLLPGALSTDGFFIAVLRRG